MPSSALFPALKFLLYQFKNLWTDDGFVVALHIVLWDFTLINLFLFGEEVHRVGFLQECVTLVFFVGEDATDCSGIPFLFAAR